MEFYGFVKRNLAAKEKKLASQQVDKLASTPEAGDKRLTPRRKGRKGSNRDCFGAACKDRTVSGSQAPKRLSRILTYPGWIRNQLPDGERQFDNSAMRQWSNRTMKRWNNSPIRRSFTEFRMTSLSPIESRLPSARSYTGIQGDSSRSGKARMLRMPSSRREGVLGSCGG